MIDEIYKSVVDRDPGQPEFHQAVKEVFDSLAIVLEKRPKYRKFKILERIAEPERVLQFRVPWVDDSPQSAKAAKEVCAWSFRCDDIPKEPGTGAGAGTCTGFKTSSLSIFKA